MPQDRTIIRDAAGRHYAVREYDDPALSHVYSGVRVKKVKGEWVPANQRRGELPVRKAGTVIVEGGDS